MHISNEQILQDHDSNALLSTDIPKNARGMTPEIIQMDDSPFIDAVDLELADLLNRYEMEPPPEIETLKQQIRRIASGIVFKAGDGKRLELLPETYINDLFANNPKTIQNFEATDGISIGWDVFDSEKMIYDADYIALTCNAVITVLQKVRENGEDVFKINNMGVVRECLPDHILMFNDIHPASIVEQEVCANEARLAIAVIEPKKRTAAQIAASAAANRAKEKARAKQKAARKARRR